MTYPSMRARDRYLRAFGFQMVDQANNHGFKSQTYEKDTIHGKHIITCLPLGEWQYHSFGSPTLHSDAGPQTLAQFLFTLESDQDV